MPKVAFFTFGILREERDHPSIQEYVDRGDPTFEVAESSDGFIDRSVLDPETDQESWGELVPPRFSSHGEPWEYTLSRWKDLESIFAFAYSGFHSENLRKRSDWFLTAEWPTYTAWWVADGHTPDFHEAKGRIEHLHDHGPTPSAFDFKHPFGIDGDPIEIDRALVQKKIEHNTA